MLCGFFSAGFGIFYLGIVVGTMFSVGNNDSFLSSGFPDLALLGLLAHDMQPGVTDPA